MSGERERYFMVMSKGDYDALAYEVSMSKWPESVLETVRVSRERAYGPELLRQLKAILVWADSPESPWWLTDPAKGGFDFAAARKLVAEIEADL